MRESMKKWFFLIAALLVTFASHAQSNFSSKLIGLGVVVSDLDLSLDFYVNGIGMVKAYSFTINEEFSKRSGLSNGVPASVTVLKLENSPDASEWKLMSFGKKATHPKQTFIQDDTGVQYITIHVKALKPVIERLKQRNVAFLGSSPTPLNQNTHFVLVQDPDGTFIELIGPME
ncbi:catechol 2,3-dioxygenase-like lactoylglutathione lyase family enzyme [Pontibacter ummariensis]|uniref:Catechol 2,3-dioxygenase n=2 Tax=Pontibacter ummariensis TaxID=1610492 RepID=A0A239K0R9_9BACT|nr:catechol 2,3-dioxygenase-like lactoylglutathione lyase family enzyme [Pontibacter ummariensis]SNT11957.1 Catechol 2,3-dioxygenase [Pontibacter ummariensis]